MKTREKFQMSKEQLKNVLGGLEDSTISTGCWAGGCQESCKEGCINGCKLTDKGGGITPPIQKCVVVGRM